MIHGQTQCVEARVGQAVEHSCVAGGEGQAGSTDITGHVTPVGGCSDSHVVDGGVQEEVSS